MNAGLVARTGCLVLTVMSLARTASVAADDYQDLLAIFAEWRAFDQPPLTRRERVENVRKQDAFTKYGKQARAVLEALLQKYQDEGVTNLDDPHILRIAPFDAMGTPIELLKTFGGRNGFEQAVHELQHALYEGAA